ncbi:MAG: sugar phosphate isomerase/epimerase, partial [Rhodospirillales bacterium]|nr:sugar phosphate isomerase/epimerase [Rhodospirillales bacterium]
VEGHGTCFCFEPLGPDDTDFINSARESLAIVNKINHPALRVQLDAKALIENGEANMKTFEAVKPMLVHYHANEPGLGVLGTSGKVDHDALGGFLRAIGYDGYVSIEQRLLDDTDPLTNVKASVGVLRTCYGMRG